MVTVVAQFTAKTINSEKAIYFLSLMSCSMKKLKSHMLFTSKNFMFSDFPWKIIFCSRKCCLGLPPFSTVLQFGKKVLSIIRCAKKLSSTLECQINVLPPLINFMRTPHFIYYSKDFFAIFCIIFFTLSIENFNIKI